MGPLLLTDDFVKGEMKCGLSGYLYVQCSSCMELNRVPYCSQHRDPSKPKAKGMPSFSVNTKLGADIKELKAPIEGNKCQQVENMPLGLTVKYNMSYGHLGALYSCKSFTANASTDHCPSSVCLSNGTWSDFSISCGVDDCYNNSSAYRGKVSCSALGTTCKNWDSVNTYDLPSDPADHPTNYCRDPKGEGRPYCYKGTNDWEYEYCHVTKC
ncbi:unnamed protein product [Mytilus edulis]|uniref:Kringle domain-containing protein n=1 Tax=Mytilus edulis TaxID=6550 RepID=A0A8S3TK25_MYTED|nr:unnamed protein product [Mytilus edulis]